METDILEKMKDTFREKFGKAHTASYFSPGRVNLIGEHTDYNGGHVFPCAISLGIYALAAKREEPSFRVYSMNLPEQGVAEFPLEGLSYDEAKDWANYPMGVVDVLGKEGYRAPQGLDIVFYGTLPNGAGLSSSASIEVLTAVIMDDLFGFGMDRIKMVKLCQKAENRFVGVQCGIMDQFAVGMGKKDCAILLDCNTLEYRYSKLDIKDCSIVITNTNKKHSLVSSAYNERRSQCEHALAQLQKGKAIQSLGELTKAEFDDLAHLIEDPVERRRARHAVYENRRTLEAVEALEGKNLKRFGELMHDAHVSMRDDYEATGPELDALAELAWQEPGLIGSRMTGGGFAGCTVSIVENRALDDFQAHIAEGYTRRIGYAPSFYIAQISDGTHRIG